jgi:predicted  nucleic acid-binding Zn-ribbon protein
MSKARLLYDLQEMDIDIEQKTGALAKTRELIGKDEELVSARAELDAARKRLLDLQRQQKEAEWGVEELENRIAGEEKKLYDGSVKNPRELMNLQQEIDLVKGKLGEREEYLLNVMMEVDAANQDASQRSLNVEAMEKGWREDQEQLAREQARLEADLATLTQKREAFAGQIDADSIGTYAELRRVKQGLAVAKLVQGRCEGCRISLPVSDQRNARSGHKLATCSNCGRILYMD